MKSYTLIHSITIILFAFLIANCNPKNIPTSVKTEDILPEKVSVFPDDWFGYWTGELQIYDANGLKQTVPMALDLSKTDTVGLFNWAIIYGSNSTAQKRDYQIKTIDKDRGHYLIDEKNGIFLDAYFLHNDLTSIFEVMGNSLITTYSLHENVMTFDIKMYPSKEVRISGDTLIDNQEIPKVSSYKVAIHQLAKLHKKCLVE